MNSESSTGRDTARLSDCRPPGVPERSDVLLELAAELAHFGGWEVLLPGREVWWSEQVYALFEIPPGTPLSLNATVALCAPEYQPELRALFEACARDGVPYDTTIEAVTASGRRIWVRSVGRAIRGADGAIVRVQGAVLETTGQKMQETEAMDAARRLRNTLETMSDAFFTIDAGMRFSYLNREAERMLQRPREELLGRYMWDEFPQAVGGPSYREYGRALRERVPVAFEEHYPPLGRWFDVRGYPTEDGLAVYFHDISKAKQAQRALHMLSRCNHLLVHAVSEGQLLEQVCRVAVDIGGYRLAWAGSVASGASAPAPLTVAAQAWVADSDAASFGQLVADATASSALEDSPAALALRRGEAVIIEDLGSDARFGKYLEGALVRGLRGAVLLPVAGGNRTIALLALHTAHPIGSAGDELALLQELANNVGFGIQSLRAQAQQEQLHAALGKVAASVSVTSGEHFLEQLAASMAQAVGADGGFLARLLPGTEPPRARTVVAVADGKRIDDFEYLVHETPCGPALEQGHCVIPSGLAQRYPRSPAAMLGADAFVGWRMEDASGAAIGTAAVMFRQPLERTAFVTSAVRIFAARAGAELELRAATARLRTHSDLLDQAQDGIFVRDLDDRILFWNRSAERMYGWTREEAIGRRIIDLLSDDPATFYAAKEEVLASGNWRGEMHRKRKDGTPIVVEVRLSLIKDEEGAVQSILSISTDISHRRAAEREIERLAFYDRVTGLPNRSLLMDRLEHALAVSARSGAAGALMFIDLDHFKNVNETVGHQKGDRVLCEVAARLRGCLPGSDTLARFGGDEFMILVEQLSQDEHEAARQATVICRALLDAVRQPVSVDLQERYMTASAGVTLFFGRRSNSEELLKQTDMALYQAKASRNGMHFFDPAIQQEISARTALETELREASGLDEFQLYYQPQVDQDGRVVGAEALIRWSSARRGAVPPSAFIPIAEQSGQIEAIGRWVLATACAQLARWEGQSGLNDLCIAVNVSARQMRSPTFVSELLDVVRQSGADPCKLKLEITESMLVENSETTIAMMHELKTHGLVFSLDDFGTGYSSLNYLKRMPLDQLKIDQSFVRDVLTDPNDAAITRTIIELGRNLRMKVIAEGVETEGQRDFLSRNGCTEFQGYFFSAPVPVAQFEAFVRRLPTAAG